ncbi:hypothetical protein C8R48DRAFT_698452 [Suillus tomentosus]|nr:hypothetical protein C8R48DRAFT_698452 [Suillus tomentosus]
MRYLHDYMCTTISSLCLERQEYLDHFLFFHGSRAVHCSVLSRNRMLNHYCLD